MATDDVFDELISTWLQETAPARIPVRALERTAERTRSSRQQIHWRSLGRTMRMPRVAPALASATVVVAVAALTLNIVGNQQRSLEASPSPSPSATPALSSPPGYMWPQSTLEEVGAAQELADAGDPRYAWQIDRDLGSPGRIGQHHPGDAQIFARFLEAVLGWDEFRDGHHVPRHDESSLNEGEFVFIRCAPGGTNPLYPDDPDAACAPTIDELQYETVKITVAQPHRESGTSIWVVTGWEMIGPGLQADSRVDRVEASALVASFLQARIDGADAEEFVPDDAGSVEGGVGQDIPLLYATSTGASYERSEFELVDGPRWPAGRMQFAVGLFAENGEARVEQHFWLERDESGRLQLTYDNPPDRPGTTENGKAVPVEYGFLDGEVTYRAAYPLAPSQDGLNDVDRHAIQGLLPDDGAPRDVLLMLADPRPIGPGCVQAPAPADAEALVRSIRSDADFETSAPMAVTVGGTSAMRMDVVGRPGGNSCDLLLKDAPFSVENRARLYVVDLPAGSSASVLAIATITDDDSFETVLEWAAPIVVSIEFHAPAP